MRGNLSLESISHKNFPVFFILFVYLGILVISYQYKFSGRRPVSFLRHTSTYNQAPSHFQYNFHHMGLLSIRLYLCKDISIIL
jgi:hypothetical protein